MGVLDEVERTAIRDVLGKGWLTHDGMWFFHTCREFGIEKANELNKAAIRSLAPIEMGRMKRLLGVTGDRFETFDDLAQFMLAGLELTLPHSVFKQFRCTPSAGNVIHWKWENSQCFAYKGMKQIGVIDGYSCGVIYRIECWLESLNIQYSIQPEIKGCLMHEKGECEGEIHVLLT
ncbi:MAG: hypothetical protein JXO48_11135 [Deltaproteobacteria bacterium]|nr:hypothetical protein [Deltaproteobacteria bacterium]